MAIKKPNYTQIPNEIIDEWMNKLSPAEFKVLIKICRNTFGWQKEKDKISLTQLQQSTNLSRPKVVDSCNKLESLDLILMEKSDNKATVFSIKITDEGEQVVNSVYQSSKLSLPDKDESSKLSLPTKESIKDNIKKVFEYWQSLPNLRKHRNIDLTIKNHIKKKHIDIINEHGLENVLEAIKNYSTVCGGNGQYWWTHKTWKCYDFLTRGIDRFLPDANPLENMKSNKKKIDPAYDYEVVG